MAEQASTDTVPLWDPKRSGIVDVPRNVADNLVRTGYHYKTGDDALREESDYGTVGKVGAVAHSYINSLGFGLPDVAAENLPSGLGGDTAREIMQRAHHQEELHPNYAMGGDVAGYFGPGGLLKVAGKGAEKVGMKSLLEVAAKHTPQHLAEKLGTNTAAKYSLGETATRLAGKAGSAVGFGVEAGVRGAAKEDVEQQEKLSTPYDVEKVAQAFGYDALVGGISDAAFGLAGEGLRGLRKGVSKSADVLQKVLPSKLVKDGERTVIEGQQTKTALKRTRREVTKEKTGTRTGGGWEKEETEAKTKSHDSTFEETKTKLENEIDDRYDKNTTTKMKPKPASTVQYKENIYEEPKADEEMGFAWDKNAKPHEIVASVRTALDDLVKGDQTDFDISRKVMEHDADYKQAIAEERHGDAYRERKAKDEYQNYLVDKYKDYGPLLKEYEKAIKGKVDLFDPAKEIAAGEKARKKIGVKTTTELSGQEPEVVEREKSKNDNYHLDQEHTTARAKKSVDTTEKTKTRSHRDLDQETTQQETTVFNDKWEPISYIVPKKEYIKHYKQEWHGPIPWQVVGMSTYLGHATGLGGVVAPSLAANIAIPHVLNQRSFYSKWLDKLTVGPATAMGKLTRNIATSYLDNKDNHVQANLSKQLRNPDSLYEQVTSSLHAHAGNEQATQQAIQHNWGHALTEHPQLQTGLIVHTNNIAKVAQAHIPPDNRPPTAQHTPYNPPRSQKVKFLRLFHAMNQPLAAMENPTPQMMQVIEQTNPETLNLMRRNIAGHIADNGKPFKGKAAQVVSMILGEPVNTRNVSAYLKRLQDTASLDAPPSEPSGGNMAGPHAGSIAGPKSAKVQQDAANLYATPQQLQQLA